MCGMFWEGMIVVYWEEGGLLCAGKMFWRRRRVRQESHFRAADMIAHSSRAHAFWLQPRVAEWLSAQADMDPLERADILSASPSAQPRSAQAHLCPLERTPSRVWAMFGAWKEVLRRKRGCLEPYLHDLM